MADDLAIPSSNLPAEQDKLLTKIHEIATKDAARVFIVSDLNPRALSPRLKGFVQFQSWFQDITPIVQAPAGIAGLVDYRKRIMRCVALPALSSERAIAGRLWIPEAAFGDGRSIVISAKTNRSGPVSCKVVRVLLALSTHTPTRES